MQFAASNQHFGDDIMDSFDNHDSSKFNASFQSSASASSSKAVLAALRALQDKIRRLESERAQALDETSQLKHQLQNQEIEFEHAKQRETLASNKSLQDARIGYDKLLAEKTELELRIAKAEERNRDARQSVDELSSKIRMLEEEKYQSQLKLKDLETQQVQLEIQIDHTQKKE